MPLIPALTVLVVSSLGLSAPSFWRDEAATVSIVRRPVAEMARVFAEIDRVHALYYLSVRPWTMVFGTGEVAVRMPSVLATALAAATVAVLARRCGDPLSGLMAGLVYAVGVTVTRYAQEARSYSLVAAVAVLAGYALVRAVESGGRRWLTGYGLTVATLGLLNLYALLLIPAHAVTLAVSRVGRRTWARWSVTIGVVLAALAPFALAALTQVQQVLWIPPIGAGTLPELVEFLAGGMWLAIPVALLVAVGVAVSGRAPMGAGPLALPWLLLPPAVLLGVSALYHPVYVDRYVVFCLPAVALLAGVGLARLINTRRAVAGVLVAVLVVLSVPAHADIRRQDSRQDDLRAPAMILRDQARSGDTVLYLERVLRWDASAYPSVFQRLNDVMLARDPLQAGNFKGSDLADPEELRYRLRKADRVWVMNNRSIPVPAPERVLERQRILFDTGPYKQEGTWEYQGGRLSLLVRMSFLEGDGVGTCGACVPWPAE